MVRFLTVCIPASNFVFAHLAVRMNPENSSVPGDCFVITVGEIHFHEPAFPSLRQLTRASNFVMLEHDAPISLAHFYKRSGIFRHKVPGQRSSLTILIGQTRNR